MLKRKNQCPFWKKKIHLNGLARIALTTIISVLAVFTIVKAGTITPPGGTPSAQFYTLPEIYNFITANATSTEGGHDFTFSDSLAGTGRTLTEIYDALAGLISADKVKLETTYLNVAGTLVPSGGTATSSNVLAGETFFGASQTGWVFATGTMADNGAFSLTASSTDQSVAAGYYSGGTLAGDTDLTTANIKKETGIFGVTGTYSGYPGADWSGSGVTNAATCEANSGWYWFEDGNGDGDDADPDDPEDGLCVKAAPVTDVWSWNGAEQVDGDNDAYDNSWIGDRTCNDPDGDPATLNGTVVWGDYPTSAQVGGTNHIALATADCYDGTRDLLPTVDESVNDDRIVYSGIAETGSSTALVDTDANWPASAWLNQKVKIFSGTSAGSEGIIATSTADTLEVASWSAGNPDETSQYGIIYIKPWSCYRPDSDDGFGNTGDFCNGPLKQEVLSNWKGSRLPSGSDFYGICSSGGNNISGNYETSCSSDKTAGSYGGQTGRTGECIDPANWEWLSEQHYNYSARIAGNNACSYFGYNNVFYGFRFRGVFRP